MTNASKISAFLSESQWWPVNVLRLMQHDQVRDLLIHAKNTTVAYSDIEIPKLITQEFWDNLPIIDKAYLQKNRNSFISSKIPEHFGSIVERASSGSTGTPLKVLHADINYTVDNCVLHRWLAWSNFDVTKKFAMIRPIQSNGEYNDWLEGVPTGTMHILSSSTPISEQAAWLNRNMIEYMITIPSNLAALASYVNESGIILKLNGVATLGETVGEGLHEKVEDTFGCKLIDLYSSQELMSVAMQCEVGTYHVADEVYIVEILDENNRQVAPGEVGAVVITHMKSFAMPLIRYRNGDYAKAGNLCGCMRNLTPIDKIYGRSRNMLTLPNGDKLWPSFPIEDWWVITDKIERLQLIQRTIDSIEINLNVSHQLTSEEEESIIAMLTKNFRYAFRFSFHYDVIPNDHGTKFEDFISYINTIN